MASNPYGSGTTPNAGGIDVGGGAAGLGAKAQDAAQNFGQQAGQAAHDLGSQANQALSGLKDQAGDLREQAQKLKDQALDQARTAADQGKTRAADTIHGVADSIRQSASQLGQNQTIAPVGKYATQAADALEKFAGTLRQRDVEDLVQDVSAFVRRNPAVAVGVAVAAGFALTQLLRAPKGSGTLSGSNDTYTM